MTFDLNALASAVGTHGRIARVLVARTDGSVPRDAGTAMLVWDGGQSGTIGGGALEFNAAEDARAMLKDGGANVARKPLGPALGQCCGGAVTLVTEVYDAETLGTMDEDALVVRQIEGQTLKPASVRKAEALSMNGVALDPPVFENGWLAESVTRTERNIWIYGAGHVGRAMIDVLAPIPGVAITWVDTGADRFPTTMPDNVSPLVAGDPGAVVHFAPHNAEHLILTYSHQMDLDICHRVLSHSFARVGLIGSETKWARFRSRLSKLGHGPQQIARIQCPIGDLALGKHPQAIAIGVAAEMLSRAEPAISEMEDRA